MPIKTLVRVAAFAAGVCAAAGAHAARATRAEFGATPDGTPVEAVVLTSAAGITARIITYGATLQSLLVPDRDGRIADVVLGYADLDGYVRRPQYFGATVGRYANRIADAGFDLDGRHYALAANDGANALHGGERGFDKVVWRISDMTSAAAAAASVTLAYVSPDGEEGYPGTLRTRVTYSLDDDGILTTSYEATTDAPTVVNLTHHSLFNLAGVLSGRSVLGQRLMVSADEFTPVDATLIPTGERRPVAGTPFDFTESREIGARMRDASDAQIVVGRGYDHNFVLRGGVVQTPRLAARMEDPVSGRVMELFTTEPGLQVYSGNFLDATVIGKGDVAYRQGDGLALEPQKFPDSPNQPSFPSARLNPGDTYRQVSWYRFSVL
ncbi:MAG: aldose epimerase family protein [Gammaproteobacteria bacterium]|jgi:aldose 1-epimerase